MVRKQKITLTKTLVDVTVPAGSEASLIPFTKREGWDLVSVLVRHGDDLASEWTMPRADAIKLGIIGEAEESVESLTKEPDNLA